MLRPVLSPLLPCLLLPAVASYLVGRGLNVRFAQLLWSDPKLQCLRADMMEVNTKKLGDDCSGSADQCMKGLAPVRYKPSKQFHVLARAVVDYVKNNRTARPTGYVGTAVYCRGEVCVPDNDPPPLYGGCVPLIGCGGTRPWKLEPQHIDTRRFWDGGLNPSRL